VARATRNDDADTKAAIYEAFIAADGVTARVSYHIHLMHDGVPPVGPADVVAGQRYLRACVGNMTLAELNAASDDALLSLWARGSVGAAVYRARVHGAGRGRRARDDVDD
jgi:hypothetical protein